MSYKPLFILFFPLVLCSTSLQAQQFTVSGYVTDRNTGEVLIGANVYEPRLKLGTVTNNYGFFSITLPSGSRILQISYIGYDAQIDSFKLLKNMTMNIDLLPSEELEELVVKESADNQVNDVQMSKVDIPISQIQKIPAIMGEVDVIKAIQLLPGVQKGNEGASGMYVRGGSPDQNLILLDGVPVYNVNHLFGFFSVFNSDAINSFQLYKGGFPARFGGRLSSVLDINMKEGNNQKLKGLFSISPIAGRFTLEGPLGSERTTFSVSGRRTWFDLLTRPFQPQTENAGYFFYDVNAKVNHRISDRDRVFLSFYGGRDKLYARFKSQYQGSNGTVNEKEEAGLNWGNVTGAFRWNHVHSARLFANYSVNYTRYRCNIFDEYEYNDPNNSDKYIIAYKSGIQDIILKADYDYSHNSKHYIRFGANLVNHVFTPGAISVKVESNSQVDLDTLLGNPDRTTTQELAFYAEDEYTVNAKFKINYGLRLVSYFHPRKSYFFAEPRFSMRYSLNEKTSLKASYSNMNQFIHLLTNSGVGLPTDLWVPATDKVKPQNGHQVAAGIARMLPKNWELSIEGYYKWMRNAIDYKEGADFLGVESDWQDKVENGKGWAYGMEFLLQKKQGRFTGWLGYTLAWTWRQFDNINFGRKYPFKYDRRHDISVVAMYDLNKKRSISMTWVFSSGNAFTFPIGRYISASGNTIYEYEGKNTFRMPYYMRMDFGTTRIRQKSSGIETTVAFSVYNVLNRANPYFVTVDYKLDGTPYASQVSLFPIIPAISYTVKF